MDTFNISFVIKKKQLAIAEAVVTIVCASDQEIDKDLVQKVAMDVFKDSMKSCSNMEQVFRNVISSIRQKFGIQAVMINADRATIISL